MEIIKSKLFNIQLIFSLITILILSVACSGSGTSTSQENLGITGKVKVAATTPIIGDAIKQVGGELIELEVILPVDADPHGFEPTPQDISKLTQEDVLFINGAGLETFLDPIIESSGREFRIVDLSQEVPLIGLDADHEAVYDQTSGNYDPHIWMNPNNIILWVMKISSVLSELDENNSAKYESNANDYIRELENLDIWIKEKVEEIPIEQRKIVTDHLVFSYFAEAYGFDQVGAAIPAFSTQAQPSAQELAALEDIIREKGIKAIFVGESANPNLTRRIAEDTGIQLVFVHTGTLTEEGGTADNYIDLIRYDVMAIVNSLR